ncbi:5-methylcytosine rRNA methyltransferase l(2)10685 [Calliopsis andreniformis]|uniref:5-methylcytosine rRNA methyltransferase l(2)10685 n=1 Tax=Calliopsis andreniformis TaxID=337506 RepID=UPI003FCDBC9C
MAFLINRLRLGEVLKVPVRYKNPSHHWSVLKKKKTCKDKALQHFDEFYGSVYGAEWENIRAALLEEKSKYVAVVNNFSDTDRIRSDLELLGAINLKALYNSQRNYLNSKLESKKEDKASQPDNLQNVMDTLISDSQVSEVQKIYPDDQQNLMDKLRSENDNLSNSDDTSELVKTEKKLKPVKMHSIEEDLNETELESDRIVDPSVNVAMLYEYVPATKIKGLNDWVLESDHYAFYNKGGDFKVDIVKESNLPFPEHLHVYTFEPNNMYRFPSPKKGSTDVLDYFLFDGASILPILALDIQAGDIVLDMCAAPGGKTLAIFQTLMPRILVANDLMESRVNRINNIIQQYLANLYETEKVLYVTEQDARYIDDKDIYNKILVDVPCTTDRHVLHSDDNNLFKPSRLKERLKIPEKQSEILINALKLITVGGTVVYATCSLSPIQNDGVVQVALKKIWEETDSVMIVKDMSEALRPLEYMYKFAKIELKYGHIAVPTAANNWGPMYFCKIQRVR